ncbi:hypothetical protein HQN64_10230 [Enterobacteriaceae bacterium BIT-l23]|uniref:hypothetical protein n=1 Tax=Jejubacter sp. L23 TaxID=3092086 RepID=UPI001585B981|nr:hypothetical protein [Enterobacteriaceae bacterium BIT-l23]
MIPDSTAPHFSGDKKEKNRMPIMSAPLFIALFAKKTPSKNKKVTNLKLFVIIENRHGLTVIPSFIT